MRDARGEPIRDDTLLILFNGGSEPLPFCMPAAAPEARWERVVDTACPDPNGPRVVLGGRDGYDLAARSVVLLRQYSEALEEESDATDEKA